MSKLVDELQKKIEKEMKDWSDWKKNATVPGDTYKKKYRKKKGDTSE